MRRRSVAGCLLAGAMLLGAAQAMADPATAAKGLGRELDLQTEMPVPPVNAQYSFWPHLSLPDGAIKLILWGSIILGVAIIAYAMRDSLPMISRSRRLRAEDGAAPEGPSVVSRMEEAQVEADDLARQGLFAEAMHVLLLRSLIELRQRLGLRFAESMTSREILRLIDLPDQGRAGLADLVARVERAYFGEHAVAAADYAACRRSYEALTGALGTPPSSRAIAA